jgi:hypothetical protein
MLQIMGIGAHEYEKVMKAFRAQVRRALLTVGAEQAESDEAVTESARQRLKELAESAGLIGAHRFSRWYARFKGST